MKTILERFEDINLLTVDILNLEVNFLKNTLEVLRVTSQISNDAFLDAGIIQGGLSLISNLSPSIYAPSSLNWPYITFPLTSLLSGIIPKNIKINT